MQHTLQSSQLSSSLSMVSAGGGFALVPKSMAAISPPNVTYHALRSPELYTDIALCWRRFERSRTVKRFLAMMSEGSYGVAVPGGAALARAYGSCRGLVGLLAVL